MNEPLPATVEERCTVALAGDRTLVVQRGPGQDELRLVGPGGLVSLSLVVTAEGVVLQFDGQFVLGSTGAITGIETRNLNGAVTSAAAVTGKYTVSSNCSGAINYSFDGTTVHLNIYFVNGKKGFLAIETDSGTVASYVFQQ